MNIEYEDSGVAFHIMHPPLTDTKIILTTLIPREFKASPGV